MMRKRLRPTPSAAELARLYATPHDHTRWADHLYRVDVSSAMADLMLPPGGSIADLSCGNGMIAKRLQRSHPTSVAVLGDFAFGYDLHGPIEQTIEQITRVDLFICSETIEHLDDPDAVLARIREKTDQLILSTPDGEDDDRNPEHVWGFDAECVEGMLRKAGFNPFIHTTVDTRPSGAPYSFQIWACR